MSKRNKSRRILLSILLCGCMTNYAHAATYPFETSFTNEGTGTYSEGGEVAEGTWSYEIQGEEVDFEVTYTYDNTAEPTYDEDTETYIGTFTDATGGIINDGGSEYDNFINGSSITGTFIGFTMVDHGDGVATNPYYVSGAIYNYGDGQVINNITAGFLLDGEDLTQEEEEQHSDGKELGGAIYNGGGATINSITNSFFLGDDVESLGKKDRAGGAIYNTGSYIGTIENCYFIGDMAITTGETTTNGKAGAIYNGIISTIGTITGSYFIGNEATMYGGAIENEYSTIGSITGSFFIENKVTGASNNDDIAETSGYGGAIYNYYDNKNTDAYIGEIKNCYFIENYANYKGGAIYNEGGTIENISGSYFIENVSGGYGGAIYNDVQNSKVEGDNYINISDSYFTDNRAEGGRGGAIYNSSDGIIKSIEGTSFTGNSATTEEGYAVGGAIFNTGTITEAEFTELTGNYAVSEDGSAGGGAIFNMGHITITGADIADNYAEGTDYVGGGAILNINLDEPTEVDITISSLTGNHAVSTGTGSDLMAVGGGIADYDGIVTINGSVENNYAQGANAGGGAVAGIGTTVTITGDITGNYAIATNGAAAGGAVAGIGTTVTITGNVTGNYATATGGGDYSGAAGGAFYNSGTEDTKKGTLIITEGEISGNWVQAAGADESTSEGYNAAGGAIYNAENGILSITDDVTFSGNYAVSEEGAAAGGAIYNAGTTGDNGLTLGSLTGNYAQGATDAKGGAIYDETSTEVTINGDVSGNYVKVTGEGDVAGGVLYLKKSETEATTVTVSGDVTGNHAETASGEAKGGAFYNNAQGTLTITGDISGNWVSAAGENKVAYGGAIYNEGTLNITDGVTLSGNYAVSENSEAAGGAIYNIGTVGEGEGTLSLGSVTGNYAEGATGASGGAIYDEVSTEVTINGDVSDNYVKTKSGDVAGGVLYLKKSETEATTVTVSGNITGNHAETENGTAYGGAFYNGELGTLTVTAGEISGNYVSGTGDAAGGAIYDVGGSSITVTGNITGNYVSTSGDAKGGAIYTSGDVNVIADGTDIAISGNYTEGSDGKDDNAIYLSNADGTVTFNISNNGSVTLADNIRGEDGYGVDITGDSADTTTFYLLNDVYNANLTAGNTTINTVNNEIHQYAVKSFTLTGDVNMAVDVDLANGAVDSFTAESYGSHEGTLTITGLNIMSDATSDTLEIPFAEDGLKDYVTLSSDAASAMTPIYKYDIAYDDRSDAGYLVFNQTGNNPAVLDAEEAEAGAMAFMNMMFKYAFEHSDYYMKLPSKVRLAIREKARSAKEGETVDAAADAAAMEAEGAYRMYNGHSLTEAGVWVKPFSSNETIPFKNEFTARTKNYGILVGADTEFKEKGKWASVFTGYAGYDGIQQTFSGNNVKQNGGLVGVTETLYKNNFYVALTATAGENEVKARNMYGTDKTHLYMYGVGAKAGYSLEFADGKYSVLPTFMVSYTYADMKDYTNGAGVRIDSSGMHAIELNPNVKLVRNFDNGWQPYVTVGEVWNVGQGSGTRADGIELDKFSYRPYTEYGLGVQKNWGGSYNGYAEFLGHAGGRRGFLATLGFRWAF